MGETDFWDDSDRAAAVSAEHARASKRLQTFDALRADIEDLDGLVEIAGEDASLQAEIDEQLASVEERLEAVPTTPVTRS
jgi:peptide chain release factor 2